MKYELYRHCINPKLANVVLVKGYGKDKTNIQNKYKYFYIRMGRSFLIILTAIMTKNIGDQTWLTIWMFKMRLRI